MAQTLRDIAVFFDTSEAGQHLLEVAARFAGEQGARLVGVWAAEGDTGTLEDELARGGAIEEVVRRHEAALATRLLRTGYCLASAAARHAINAEFRVIPGSEAGSTAALRSLYCDLLVVGYPQAPGLPFAWTYAELLEQTGESLLIVPRSWKGAAIGRRITVAWNASRPARRAIADALPLLASAQAVDLLIVDTERRAGLHGEEPGMDMAAYLARQGVQVDLRRIVVQAAQPVAEVIVAQARERGADLIVFGAYGRSRTSEAVFYGVTRSLLAEVPLPLFVSG